MAAVDLAAAQPRSVRIAGRDWPVALPSLRDARLHTAAVVMTVHVLGQVALGFAVSVPQILAAIFGAGFVEFAIAVARRRMLVWPASAMLTGSGVGLIFRVDGTLPGEHWSVHRWWWFSLVAVGSLLTKYVIRWRGTHLFNPSNLGLVAAFVVLGPGRAEPLPFHWGGPGPALAAAYIVIVAGGVVITRRLGLLWMALTFWVALALGLGVVSWSGHCMNVPWQILPVCDASFWWAVTTSPELCVFVFFMLTDPRTVPAERGSRIGFAIAVAGVATLLIATQRTEYGAKVALLGSLTLVCALRPAVALVHRRWGRRTHRTIVALSPDVRGLMVGFGTIVAAVVFAATTVAAGARAREPLLAVPVEELPPLPRLPSIGSDSPRQVPDVSIGESVLDLDPEMAEPAARGDLLRAVLLDLQIEAALLRQGDAAGLAAVDHGARLVELRSLLDARSGAGVDRWPAYAIDSAELVVHRAARQGSAVLALEVNGTTTDASRSEPWGARISVRRAADGRWLIVELTEITQP